MSDRPKPDPRPDDLDAELRELFAAEQPGPEPTADELAAWLSGELSSDQEDRLMDRIADCPDAMDTVLAMRRQLEEVSAQPETPSLDPDTSRAVDSVMAAVSALPERPPTPEHAAWTHDPKGTGRKTERWKTAGRVVPWAAAAVLTIAVAMQSARIDRLTTRLESASPSSVVASTPVEPVGKMLTETKPTDPEPTHTGVEVGVQVVELFASSRLRAPIDPSGGTFSGGVTDPATSNGASPLERVDVSSTRSVVLILTPQDPTPGRVYGVAISSSDQQMLWQGETTADDTGVVVIRLPAGFASPGPARLELTDPSQRVEEFGLRFVAEQTAESP